MPTLRKRSIPVVDDVTRGRAKKKPRRDTRDERPDAKTATGFTDQSTASGLPTPPPIGRARSPTAVLQTGPDTCPSISSSVPPSAQPYEACFGVLALSASSNYCRWRPQPSHSPVVLHFCGPVALVKYVDGGQQAGMVLCPALATLVTSCPRVTLSASIGPAKSSRDAGRLGGVEAGVRERPLRVVVYGFLEDKDAVMRILDGGALFLQRPEEGESDPRARYFNPMYLLRDGEDMPRDGAAAAAKLAARLADEVAEEAEEMGEMGRERVLRIFDEASGGCDGVGVVQQSARIVSELKEHQLEALAMMIEREDGPPPSGKARFPLLWEEETDSEGVALWRHVVTGGVQSTPLPSLRGGILADEMGLGKTLSTIALICHRLDHLPRVVASPSESHATLVVAPKSTIYGWQQQVARHTRPGSVSVALYHGPGRRRVDAAALRAHDVVLTTYDTLRSDFASSSRRGGGGGPLFSASSPWARVVLDEAHRIRNRASLVFAACARLPAAHRWCLTGTPMQNALDDYGALLAFLGVPHCATREQFRFWVAAPVLDRRRQPHGLPALRKLVRATCLRRTKDLPRVRDRLRLPAKVESVQEVVLERGEREVYDFFKRRSGVLAAKREELAAAERVKEEAGGGKSGRLRARREGASKDASGKSELTKRRRSAGNIIVLISALRMVCNHSEALLPEAARKAWKERDEAAVGWAVLQDAAKEEEAVKLDGECAACRGEEGVRCSSCEEGDDATGSSTGTETVDRECAPSSKIKALLANLETALDTSRATRGGRSKHISKEATSPVKSVIFSQWTGMLDQISTSLHTLLSALDLTFVRIDGQSTLQQRRAALDAFNGDARCVVMLATVGAVGEGIDLSAASRVHLVEPHWNPMAEAQAVDRVHRIGQTREVVVTRYCVKDSVEEYVQLVRDQKLRLISESLKPSEQSAKEDKRQEVMIVEEQWQKLLKFLQ